MLVGRSGSGKSYLLRHLAVQTIGTDLVPIWIQVKYFAGSSDLLDRASAPFSSEPADSLLNAVVAIAKRPLLIADALNECPLTHRSTLQRDLQATVVKWNAVIVTSSQDEIELIPKLRGTIFTMGSLNAPTREAVFRSHSSENPPAAVQELDTPYQIALLAQSIKSVQDPTNPYDLLSRYSRRALDNVGDPIGAKRILIALAEEMGREYSYSLTLNRYEQICHREVERSGLSGNLATDILKSALLETHQGRCSFQHENLKNYFEAEGALRLDAAELVETISRPKYESAATLLLGAQESPDLTLSLCSKLSTHLLAEVLQGSAGKSVRYLLQREAHRVLDKAKKELAGLRVIFPAQNTKLQALISGETAISGGCIWSDGELCLLRAISTVWRREEFLGRVLSLIDETWNSLEEKVAEHFSENPKLKLIRTQLFATVIHSDQLAAGIIVKIINHSGWSNPLPDDLFLQCTTDQASALRLYMLCSSMRGLSKGKNRQSILSLVKRCWQSGLYHLQLEGLELSKSAAIADEQIRNEMASFLLSLPTPKNLFLSTTLVEALHAFGLIEAPHADLEELTKALDNPLDPTCQNTAYSMIARMFDEIGDNYSEVIESLSESDQLRMYAMGALSEAAKNGFFLDYCVQKVVKLTASSPDHLAERALRRWSEPPNVSKAPFPQEPIAAFVAAVHGLARLGLDLKQPSRPLTSSETVWMAFGEIEYCLITKVENDPRIHDAWKRLEKSDCIECAAVLSQLEREGRLFDITDLHADSITLRCQEKVKQLLENALGRGPSTLLESEPKYLLNQLASFIFQTLGAIGDDHTIGILKPYVDLEQFGRQAISAIREIRRSREASARRPRSG